MACNSWKRKLYTSEIVSYLHMRMSSRIQSARHLGEEYDNDVNNEDCKGCYSHQSTEYSTSFFKTAQAVAKNYE